MLLSDQENVELELQAFIDRHFAAGRDLVILEAGCGSASHVRAHGWLIGIDVSQEQLDRNTALDEKIRGDLETYPLPERRFDLIVCWDVIEHLRQPEAALERLAAALGDGGAIVLKAPNPLSLKGLATRATPHWFHRLIYRRTMPFVGTGPFPTFLRLATSPASIERFAARHGLQVVYAAGWEAWLQQRLRRRLHVTGRAWRALRSTAAALTLGRVDLALTDYAVLLAKPVNNESSRGLSRTGL